MPESLKYEHNKDRNELFSFIPFGISVALILILAYILGLAPIRKYELADSDCYLRLVRVEDLYKEGNWYDPVFLRINPPEGQTSHWTRPFDILLLLGAIPLTLFTDFESALFWWGVIISPVLLVVTLIALQWSTRPILNLSKDGPFLACFVFVLQIITLSYFQAGRPDHHSLFIFVFVLSMGFTLRVITRPINVHLCYMTGAIGALSMWISVESIVPVGITIGVLGLFWLLEGGDFLEKNLNYALALFGATGLSLVLERSWQSIISMEYDRLSFVHLSIFGFIAVLWITIYVLNREIKLFRHRANRFLSVPVSLVSLAIAIFISFPKFYKGPLVDIDPRITRIWLSKIAEIQPLLSLSCPLQIQVQLISSVVVCFPFLFYQLLRKVHSENRKSWIYISISLVVFILLSLYQIRWSIYPQVLLSIPMARLMVLIRQRGPKTGFLKTLKNMLILLLFLAGPLCLGLFAERFIKRGDSTKSNKEVSLIQVCDYLAQAEEFDGRDKLILTHVDFGAEILYRTEYKVLSTTHHRTGQGIWDTYKIMMEETDEKAHELIQKRKVDLILLCPKSNESVYYSKPGHESTFYKRLCEDMIPSWLKKVELPSDLSSSFLLFRIME